MKQIAEKCTNADYRLGYTGTLPDNKADLYNIHGFIGPTIFDLGTKELMDKGLVAKMKIINVKIKYPDKTILENKGMDYFQEEDFIATYTKRNSILKQIFDNIPDWQKSLVLVRKIEHLKLVQEYLEETLDEKYMIENIHGKVDPVERESIRNVMETAENMILVSTYGTMSTGVSINNLHNVFFASSSKSKIRVLQSIGRGLRKHASKLKVIIWDLVDDLSYKSRNGKTKSNYTLKHSAERIKFYKDEGFEFQTLKIKL